MMMMMMMMMYFYSASSSYCQQAASWGVCLFVCLFIHLGAAGPKRGQNKRADFAGL
jgi:O-antigen/teichoic acid export membrane protein